MFAFLLVALLVTLAVAIAGWFRPLPAKQTPPPTYSSQQIADAKTAICAAYQQVRKAGDLAGARSGGSDPMGLLAVATSSRQVFDAGSRYLSTKLAEQPATPPDLAAAIQKLANIYQQLAIDYLAEAPDSETNPLIRAGTDAHTTIEGLCK
ncbi:hypothetical protein AWC29_11925 [Mycobacterium triplex]|uniref:Alanine and proline rich membrane protein n=2 Tax=Mycobacterium triplex TaxID=47839 RepID=A0ABX3W622_9MYCO|nr:hypothetical protein AWC29_11925 [Mycobacterium triplex]